MNYGKRKLPSLTSFECVGSSSDVAADTQDDTVKRKFRNLNEKKRRDQFNMLINELSGIVCSSHSRRVDKTSVLQQAISFLECHKGTESSDSEKVSYSWKPSFLSSEEFMFLMLEAMDCITLALDKAGKILYTSENAQSKLDVAQKSVTAAHMNIGDGNFIDMEILQIGTQLQDYLAEELAVNKLLNAAQSQPNRLYKAEGLVVCESCAESRKYQAVDVVCIPETIEPVNGNKEKEAVCNCILRLKVPSISKELFGPTSVSFKAKHSVDMKILYMENKSVSVLGFQPFEILGTSGYDYYHPEDLEHMAVNHTNTLRTGCSKSSCYRMLTKGQNWVWMQTDFYMCYNQWNGKPEHIEAIYRVARKDTVLLFKKDGPQLEEPSAKRLKAAKAGNISTSLAKSVLPNSPKQVLSSHEFFSAYLADIGINQNREAAFVRPPQMSLLEPASSSQAHVLDQALEPPRHLSPAAVRLHQQLVEKYHTLKASLEKQQQELSELYHQLSHLSSGAQSSPVSSLPQIPADNQQHELNPQDQQQIYLPNYSDTADSTNRATLQMGSLPVIDIDDQMTNCTHQ